MGIKQVYTIGGNVCTLGGYAMGPTALPDPKPKTLVISTDNAACTASASAYRGASAEPRLFGGFFSGVLK